METRDELSTMCNPKVILYSGGAVSVGTEELKWCQLTHIVGEVVGAVQVGAVLVGAVLVGAVLVEVKYITR